MPELLDDDAGYLTVTLKSQGQEKTVTLDVYAAYMTYGDAMGQATVDDRNAACRRWAAELFGVDDVSMLTASRLSRLVAAPFEEAKKKPGPAGSTGSGSAGSPPPTSDSSPG